MSRGYDDQVWRSITPATTNTYNLGSSTNKWGTVYATTFNGNATSATTATSANTATTATNLSGFTNTTTSPTAIDSAIQNGHVYVNNTSGIYNIIDGAAFVQAYNSNWVAQIYQDYRTGQIALRSKNNGTWQAWRKVLDSVNVATYALPISGGTLTGAVSGTSFSASSYIAANSGGSNNTGGISLWGTNPLEYGIAMRGTGNGKFGYVQSSNWAVYFSVNGPDSDPATTRGWIFRNHQTNSAVASISGGGNITAGGSVTVGGNATNTSGCEMVFDATTNSLNFTFK